MVEKWMSRGFRDNLEGMSKTAIFVRFQKPGRKLPRRSEETSSGEPLPKGFIFAYADPIDAFNEYGLLAGGWAGETPFNMEAVSFLGKDAFDPGDYEGVAVIPGKVVRREPVIRWLKKQLRSRDPEIRSRAEDAMSYWENE
jgi:hypothetical protein